MNKLPQVEEAAPKVNYKELGLAALIERTVTAEKELLSAERQLGYARDLLARRTTEVANAREEYAAVRAAIREAVAE